MARVVAGGKSAAIDPLKHSQPLGGALVFLGLARAMPVLHGSQGCASFAKALLTRHFREPIPLQTTAVTEVSAVLGAGESMVAALDAIRGKQHPEIIGLLTTGLTEVSGEDVPGELSSYLDGAGPDAPLVVGVSTPDFRGGLSDGYAAALEALMRVVPLDRPCPDTAGTPPSPPAARGHPARPGRPTMLVGPALSVADLDELGELARAFGLDPIIVPDLSGSLDGHLGDEWSPLTTGGTTLAELRQLGARGIVTAVGATATGAAKVLARRTGAAVAQVDHLCGLGAVDALVGHLSELSGAPVPPGVRRWRSRLADGLLDAHFVLGGARVALALEPDQLSGVASLLHDVGAEIVTAVTPTSAPVLAAVPCDEVVVGDLNDLEERAAEAGAELVLASSHARALTERIGAAHLAMGFPVYDRLGVQLRGGAGYRGSLHLLFEAANQLLDHHDHGAARPRSTLPPGPGADAPPFDESPLKESMC